MDYSTPTFWEAMAPVIIMVGLTVGFSLIVGFVMWDLWPETDERRDIRAVKKTESAISAHITARMKTVSPSLSAAQALDDLRMAVESGDYEGNP